ncbi:hypothetical protein [Metabacillus sp. 84]|uniref:hypothetical protein n=1 Tax=unclassified Metabacillus TaxID=2675274 RepID=UPI003CF396AB
MDMRKSIWPVLMAVCIIGASLYMSSWDAKTEETGSPLLIGGEEIVSVQGEAGEFPRQNPFEVESKLVGTKKVKDKGIEYKVETYREYEVYTDSNGEIIKEVPTSNFNYLRYRTAN